MSEQQELNFGEVTNSPTEFKEVISRSPRPHWHTPEVEEFVYKELAKLIVQKDETVEEMVEEISGILNKFNDFDNSYEVSKMLERDLWCDDEWVYDLRDDIESFCAKAEKFLYKKIKEWIDFWNIIPPVKVGDRVSFSSYPKEFFPNAKAHDYLITNVRKNQAEIVAYKIDDCKNKYNEEEAMEKKYGYIYPYEVLLGWI